MSRLETTKTVIGTYFVRRALHVLKNGVQLRVTLTVALQTHLKCKIIITKFSYL